MPGYDWTPFLNQLHHTTIAKNEHLIRIGQMEKHLYFLKEGVFRFYVEQETKDITFDFVFPGSFFCAFTSFLTGEPVKYSIQALTDCQVYFIEKSALEQAYESDFKSLAMGKWAAEQQFLKKSAREFSLLMETAEERYLSLVNKQPILLQNIPLKYLASYIGITPQALSRIRKRISH